MASNVPVLERASPAQVQRGLSGRTLAALAFAFFAGADAIATVLALSGISPDRYLPSPWPLASPQSIVCLVLAMIAALAAAIQLSVLRMRDLEHESLVRRLDVLKENVDKTLKELQAESRT